MTGSKVNRLLFDGEAMHKDTDKAMVLAGVAGALVGTIRPEEPWEHSMVKLALAALVAIAAMRVHPGAKKIAEDWNAQDDAS